MVWRETVPISQARSRMIPIGRGATIASAVTSTRVAKGFVARGMAGKSFRTQEV